MGRYAADPYLKLSGKYPETLKDPLRRLLAAIRDFGVGSNPATAATVVQRLQGALPLLTPEDRQVFIRALSTALRIGEERCKEILNLQQTQLIIRALTNTETKKAFRLEGEEHYPDEGWLGEYLDWTSQSESPMAYHFWCGVSAMAAAMRRNTWIDRGNHFLWPNMYVLLVGPSGIKKSQAIKNVVHILELTNEQLAAKGIEEDDQIIFFPSKVTPERMVQKLVRQERYEADGALVRKVLPDATAFWPVSELAVLLGKSIHGSERLIHLLTDLYDCPDFFEASTIGRGDDTLHHVAITMLGASTADWLRGIITTDLMTGGFTGRCIFVYRDHSDRVFPEPGALDPVTGLRLAKKLAELASMPKQPMIRTKAAVQYMDRWYRTQRKAELVPDELLGYYERKDNHIYKLAMVLAVSDGSFPEIDFKHVELATRILDKEEPYMLACFSEFLGQSSELAMAAKAIYRFIVKSAGKDPILHRTVYARFARKIRGSTKFRSIMNVLIEKGYIERIIVKEPGKQKKTLYKITGKEPDWDDMHLPAVIRHGGLPGQAYDERDPEPTVVHDLASKKSDG